MAFTTRANKCWFALLHRFVNIQLVALIEKFSAVTAAKCVVTGIKSVQCVILLGRARLVSQLVLTPFILFIQRENNCPFSQCFGLKFKAPFFGPLITTERTSEWN